MLSVPELDNVSLRPRKALNLYYINKAKQSIRRGGLV